MFYDGAPHRTGRITSAPINKIKSCTTTMLSVILMDLARPLPGRLSLDHEHYFYPLLRH